MGIDSVLRFGVCLVLLVVLVHGFVNRGYTVTFDSNGGTDVASQSLMCGDLVEDAGQPTREGYEFGGWYLDEGLTQPWDLETDTVSESMTLYASWIPIDQYNSRSRTGRCGICFYSA